MFCMVFKCNPLKTNIQVPMKYQDLLHGELSSLGHFFDEYFASKSDLDAIKIVTENILPSCAHRR